MLNKPTEWETPTTLDETRNCCFQPLQKRETEGSLTNQKSLDRQGLIIPCRLHSDPDSQREWKLFHIYRAIGYLHTSGLFDSIQDLFTLWMKAIVCIVAKMGLFSSTETLTDRRKQQMEAEGSNFTCTSLQNLQERRWRDGPGVKGTCVPGVASQCPYVVHNHPQLQLQWIQCLLVTSVDTRYKYGAQTFLKEKYT